MEREKYYTQLCSTVFNYYPNVNLDILDSNMKLDRKIMAPKIKPKPVIKEYLHDIRVRLRELRLRLNSLIRMTNES